MATVTLAIGVSNSQTTPNISSASGSGQGPYTVDFASAYDSAIEVGDLLEDGSNVFFRISALNDADTMTVWNKTGASSTPATGATNGTNRAATSLTTLNTLASNWAASGDTLIFEQHSEGGTMNTAAGTFTSTVLGTSGHMQYKAASGESPQVHLTGNGWHIDVNVTSASTPSYTLGEGLLLEGTSTSFTNSCGAFRINEDGASTQQCIIEKCKARDFISSGGVVLVLSIESAADNGSILRNCECHNVDRTSGTLGIGFRTHGTDTTIYHCTAHDCDQGVYNDGVNSVCRNCIASDCDDNDFNAVTSFATFDYCCDTDGTAVAIDATNSITETSATTFVDTSSNDFHLKSGSGCIDAGVDVSITDDLEGKTRTGTVDMGCYEFFSLKKRAGSGGLAGEGSLLVGAGGLAG